MAGIVGTTIVVKGKKVRLREAYDDRDSFKSALAGVSDEAQSMRKAAQVEAKSGRQGFRKRKASKNA